jgi:hypothetical protein
LKTVSKISSPTPNAALRLRGDEGRQHGLVDVGTARLVLRSHRIEIDDDCRRALGTADEQCRCETERFRLLSRGATPFRDAAHERRNRREGRRRLLRRQNGQAVRRNAIRARVHAERIQ